MAKPGEHTYAPITCARTKPVCPADSTAPLHCCVHCVCNSSSVSSLSLSLSQCVSALSTWHLACWHFYWLWHLLVLPTAPSVVSPCICQLAFPVAVVFLQPESWLRMSAQSHAGAHSQPVCTVCPYAVCLSVCPSVCVCVWSDTLPYCAYAKWY